MTDLILRFSNKILFDVKTFVHSFIHVASILSCIMIAVAPILLVLEQRIYRMYDYVLDYGLD